MRQPPSSRSFAMQVVTVKQTPDFVAIVFPPNSPIPPVLLPRTRPIDPVVATLLTLMTGYARPRLRHLARLVGSELPPAALACIHANLREHASTNRPEIT